MNILFILVALVALFLALKAVAFFRREEREEKDIDDSNPYLHPELAEKLLNPEMTVYVRVARPDEHDEHGKHNSDEQHSRPSSLSGLSSSTSPTKRGNERWNEKGSNKRNRRNVYEAFLKPALDNILSFLGLLLLSPVFIIVIIAIKVDDPGPVFFTQCRITRDKKFFRLHKFRSMKMSTPHDMPTHMLQNPEQYITRVGKFLRRSSLDELPQIWDIFRGRMSIIGPRPALWNQADLIFERDRWGANDIKPGLTGLAQISGRDQLEIKDKAELDGIYTQQLKENSISGFSVDIRCFFGTLLPVLRSEGIVEGKKNN